MSYRDDLEALAQRYDALKQEAAQASARVDEAAQLLADARRRSSLPVLDNIRVAAPCKADWNQMTGDERTRFCGQCEKNVYNLSSMTRAEAQALLIAKEGKLCVRYYQRADGTILTADCPDGLARRRRRRRVLTAAFGAMSAVTAVGYFGHRGAATMGAPHPVTGELEVVVAPPVVTEPVPVSVMGEPASVETHVRMGKVAMSEDDLPKAPVKPKRRAP